MDVFEKLIAESNELEATASKIQDGTSVGLSPDKVEEFIGLYRQWYAECMSVLPRERHYNFRREFEGSAYDPKIREFIEAPTDIRLSSREDILEGRTQILMEELWQKMIKFGVADTSPPLADKPQQSYWQYPYKETFLRYLHRQRQILMEVRKSASQSVSDQSDDARAFDTRDLHIEIRKCARDFFVRGAYSASVLEGCKAFEKHVQAKARSNLFGVRLMRQVLDSQNGSLKLNTASMQTQGNEQDGFMYLCWGLMSAIRNPLGHELTFDHPMLKTDALDILSFISFLYRKIDDSYRIS